MSKGIPISTVLALLAVYVLFAGVLWFYQPVVDWVLAAYGG